MQKADKFIRLNRQLASFCFALIGLCALVGSLSPARAAEPSLDLETLLDDAKSYTVKIRSKRYIGMNDDDAGLSEGTGFIIDRERGWILTNAHVASRSPGELDVELFDNTEIPGEREFVDSYFDLAVIKVDPAALPDATKQAGLECSLPTQGTPVVAFGHPGEFRFSATTGIVSDIAWLFPNEYIHSDATINSGSSGGPLLNAKTGKVVGIVTAAYEPEGEGHTMTTGLSTPAVHACKIIQLMNTGGDTRYKRLPFDLAYDFKTHMPVVMAGNLEGTKIQASDLIVAVNGETVRNLAHLTTLLRGDGSRVRIKVLRQHVSGDGRMEQEEQIEDEVGLEVVESPLQDRALSVSGVAFAKSWALDRTNPIKDQKILVADILDSELDSQGVKILMTLISVNGRQFEDIDTLHNYLQGLRDNEELRLIVCDEDNMKKFDRDCRAVMLFKQELTWHNPVEN